MELAKHKNLFLIAVVLFIAFLIESPLYTQTVALFSFIPAFRYLIVGIIGYIATPACILLITKQYFSIANFFKAFGLIFIFAVIDRIIKMLLFTEIVILFYQIIRPVIEVVFICLAIKLISKCKFKKDMKLFVFGVIAFMLGVVLNVLEYVRMITAMQGIGNDFFSYLSVLTISNSLYNIMAIFCGYIIIFIAFAFAEKCICPKNSDI